MIPVLVAIGCVTCGLVLAGLVALGIGAVRAAFEARHDRAFAEGRDYERQMLRSDAYWFSEDEATMKLVQDICTVGVSQARENWRRARKEST